MSFILLLLALGSTWRLARLFTVDEITRPLRDRIARVNDWWAYLITCPWCLSIWLAPLPAWLAVYYGDNRVVLVALVALTSSLAAGMGQVTEDRLDR